MKLISIDCESNGLYGNIWAIGAWCVEPDGIGLGNQVIKSMFGGRTSIQPAFVDDPWVLENVVPNCRKLPQIGWSSEDLFIAFASWWHANATDALVIADFGVPVESRLFFELIRHRLVDPFKGPYPLHELATMLLAAGVDPDIDRQEYGGDLAMMPAIALPHNPVYDAKVTLACWTKAQIEVNRWAALVSGLERAGRVMNRTVFPNSYDPEGQPRPGSMD